MTNTVKPIADKAHEALLPMLGMGSPKGKSCTMAGAIVVTDSAKNILFQASANYGGDPDQTARHVEADLLAHLFNYSKDTLGTPFKLTPGSRVYIYIYDSPCVNCVETVLKRMTWTWLKTGANPTVVWKLAFSKYYLQPMPRGYKDQFAANAAYGTLPIQPRQI